MICHNHHQVLGKVLTEHFGLEKPVVGIEIGTYCGDSARAILWALPNCNSLFTIDPWVHAPGHEFEAGEPQDYHNKNMELALSKFEAPDIKGRVTVLRCTSAEAHELLKKDKFDFVWIDGNHEPDAVRADIEMFYPLVKPGGLFGGHDFGQVWPLTQIIFEKFGPRLWSGPDYAWWVYVPEEQA